MKIDFLDIENKSAEEKEQKKAEFIKKLKAAIKRQEKKESKENINAKTTKKKGTRSSKTNK